LEWLTGKLESASGISMRLSSRSAWRLRPAIRDEKANSCSLGGRTVTNEELRLAFESLTTALVADSCVRLGIPVRLAPPGIRPAFAGARAAGRALPVRHFGSVDVFLEAMERAEPGDVLVVDNELRPDEGCVGDLAVLEARAAGLGGVIVLGCHRDGPEVAAIGVPVFSYGTCPAGPLPGPERLAARGPEALESVRVAGEALVTRDEAVFADADGVVFAPAARAAEILGLAGDIRETERRQAEAIRAGKTLREQLRFAEYLLRRAADPSYTFRQHLREFKGAIEE